jgi:uncharacterized protein (DUF1800 family)
MVTLNCATGTIDPYVPTPDVPWDRKRAIHLFRRLGFGASVQEIDDALGQSPTDLVDQLIDDALATPLTPEPDWAFWTFNDYDDFPLQREEQYAEWATKWLIGMLENGLRDKLSLFWHNHFVTKLEIYDCPSYMYQYHKLLQQYALGNFKDFVYEIGKTPAMLVFLNGAESTKFNPNENYARELYELFTLGVDNGYTQQDIEETSRALTGWNLFSEFCGSISFYQPTFDEGVKTIFGQTGNWGYDDVHDILFQERSDEIADFICRKLYVKFVSPEVDESIIEAMATTFKANDFEIEPVLRQLFKSEHFFDDANLLVQIKSPVDACLQFYQETSFPYETNSLQTVIYLCFLLDQYLFNPVDVAGWQGNRTWINSNTLTGRWQALQFLTGMVADIDLEPFRDLAVSLAGSTSVNDPEFVTQLIVEQFFPKGFQSADEYNRATIVFKMDIPENYYTNGLWNLAWDTVPYQVASLLLFLFRRPEWQLM